jgi:hypothetical protein
MDITGLVQSLLAAITIIRNSLKQLRPKHSFVERHQRRILLKNGGYRPIRKPKVG